MGAGGLGLAAIGMAIGADDPTTGTMIFSGTMLGLGFSALAIGGIIALTEDSEADETSSAKTTIVVTPGAFGISGSF